MQTYTRKIASMTGAELDAEHARLEGDHKEFAYAPPMQAIIRAQIAAVRSEMVRRDSLPPHMQED